MRRFPQRRLDELRENAARKEAILQTALDAIITIDHHGRVIEWNLAAEQIFGYSRGEALGREIADLIIPPSLREQHRQGLSRYLATGEQHVLGRRIELTALRADGTEFPVELAITRILLDGAPMFTSFVRDITERKRIEEALKESERQIHVVTDAVPLYISYVDRSYRYRFVNKAHEQLFGRTREDMLGKHLADVLGPVTFEERRPYLDAALAGQEVTFEGRLPEKGRIAGFMSVHYLPNFDEQGKVRGCIVIVTDITERKRAEEERAQLLAREQTARAEAEAANASLRNLLTITDTALAHLALDELLRELLGRIHEIMRADNSVILLVTEDGRSLRVRAALGPEEEIASQVQVPIGHGFAGRIAAQRAPLIVEDLSSVDIITQLLREKLRSLLGVPLRIGDRVIGVMHIGTIAPRHFTQDDVQLLQRVADRIALAIEHARLYEEEQQLRTEATLRASQLEAIFEAVVDELYVYDVEGRLLEMNSAARRSLGLDAQADVTAFKSRPFGERAASFTPRDEHGQPLPPEQWPLSRLLQGEVLKGASTQDLLVRTPSGEDVQFSLGGAPMRNQDGRIVGAVAIGHDITERRRLERRTREALDALLAMAEALVDIPAQESTSNGQASSIASEVARQLAELASRVLGCRRLSITAIEPETEQQRLVAVYGLSPEQEQQLWAEQQEIRPSNTPEQSLAARLRAKEVLLLDMTQPPLSDRPNPYGIRTMMIVPMSIEDRLVGFLYLDHGGAAHDYTADECAIAQAVAHFAALLLERQRLLRERAEAQARELALLEANQRMDAFLGIASHELKTPLTSVIANMQLAEKQFKRLAVTSDASREGITCKVETTYKSFEDADRQLWRLNRLVDELLDVSRIQANKLTLHLERCDLAAMVQRAVEELRQVNPARHIGLEVRAEVPVPVVADTDRIGQVVTNYLTNALKYAPVDRPVEVILQVEGQMTRVSVRDEGPGLTPSEQKQIWERFYRVPGIDVQSGSIVGLGLGLYICRTIIEQHQGRVGVQSIPGKGSTFWFTLPLVQQEPFR